MSGVTVLHEEYGTVVSVGELLTAYCAADVSEALHFFYSDPVFLENADVSPKDLPFLKIGAVFYRVVGRYVTPHGSLRNFSALYFLRKPDLDKKLEYDSWGTEVVEQFWQPFVGELKCSMDDIHRIKR